MTSTNINIGLNDGRNSSRVLKPPGGGHTDIFGGQQPSESQSRTMKYQKTSISECLSEASLKNSVKIPVEEKNGKIPVEEKNGKIEEVKAEIENSVNPVPQRVRVPPGGFSSGLW